MKIAQILAGKLRKPLFFMCCVALCVGVFLCAVFFSGALSRNPGAHLQAPAPSESLQLPEMERPGRQQLEARAAGEPSEIRFEDLSEEGKTALKQLLHDAIVEAAKPAREFLSKITDSIERRLLDDDVYEWLEETDKGILYTVYLIKPGNQKPPVRTAELKDHDGKLVLRYTCATGEVCQPLAFVCIIRSERREPVVTEKLLFFNAKTGWKLQSRAPDNADKRRMEKRTTGRDNKDVPLKVSSRGG